MPRSDSFRLHLLPVGPLTPDDARAWLARDLHAFGSLIRHALVNPSADAEDRAAFELLAYDVGVMAEACGRALAKAGSVKVEREMPEDSRHGAESIARILGQLDTGAEGTIAFCGDDALPVIATLARELVTRLASPPAPKEISNAA